MHATVSMEGAYTGHQSNDVLLFGQLLGSLAVVTGTVPGNAKRCRAYSHLLLCLGLLPQCQGRRSPSLAEPVFIIAEGDRGCIFKVYGAFKTKALADASLKPSKIGAEAFVLELVTEA